jgi:hypothetical protein
MKMVDPVTPPPPKKNSLQVKMKSKRRDFCPWRWFTIAVVVAVVVDEPTQEVHP